jgi:hypothetical protein
MILCLLIEGMKVSLEEHLSARLVVAALHDFNDNSAVVTDVCLHRRWRSYSSFIESDCLG